MKKNKSFVAGAIILSIGGIITKVMGAVYRIPLTNLLGVEGMGLYHLIFPFYTLLLAASSAGIPVALSRLIAERIRLNDYKGADKIFKTAYASMSIVGIFFAVLLFFMSDNVLLTHGNSNISDSYKMISPAVFLVTQISVLRGYFQGRMSMVPTAISQITEQAVKILFTMTVAISFLPDVIKAVTYSVLAVSISEAVALLLLILIYYFGKKSRKRQESNNAQVKELGTVMSVFTVFAVSVPITIGSIIFPLSQIIDSALILNILSRYYQGSVLALYGLLNGPVNSLISLPVVVTLGIAMAVVPVVSAGRVSGDKEAVKKKIEFALKLTFLIAIPCTIGLFLFSESIIRLLYVRLNQSEVNTASLLLKVSSLSVLFISLMQTAVSVLVALKRAFITTFNLVIAVALKIALSMVLLSNPAINIYGSAISAVLCYFTASMLNLMYIVKFTGIKINSYSVLIKPLICSCITLIFAYGGYELLKLITTDSISLISAILLSIVVFVITALKLEVFTDYEVKYIPVIKKLKKA